MRVVGDCETDGTLRIEGTVEGTVRAAKAVVIGKDGVVKGDVVTQDAIIGGRVTGAVVAESRLELQATCVVDGEVRRPGASSSTRAAVSTARSAPASSKSAAGRHAADRSRRGVTERPPGPAARAAAPRAALFQRPSPPFVHISTYSPNLLFCSSYKLCPICEQGGVDK
jgi:hypothetical protein